jgi:hypothetical protein
MRGYGSYGESYFGRQPGTASVTRLECRDSAAANPKVRSIRVRVQNHGISEVTVLSDDFRDVSSGFDACVVISCQCAY